jgi:iron complex outermembrane receptor protein
MHKKIVKPQRGLSRRAVVARITWGFFSTISVGSVKAEIDRELEQLVVSALRTPHDASSITSTVTVLDPRDLERRGLLSLRDALNEVPGVISTSTGGQTGALGSLLIRGTNTGYSQMVIDGMRVSDASNPLGNILGTSRVYDLGGIEVLRGAQGAIYGGESIGGVLWMETTRGEGDPQWSLFLEAGSFDSYTAAASHQGKVNGLSYFLSATYEETNNDAPNQDFHQGSLAMRLEKSLGDNAHIGMTYRGVDSFFNNLGNSDDRVDASLVTLYADRQMTDAWKARFHAGFQQEFYDSDSSFGNYGTDVRAASISTDHEVAVTDSLLFLTGVYAQRSDFKNTIGTDASRDRYGVHAGLEWKTTKDWTNYVSARWEDYDAYGKETTWRVGSSYDAKKINTIFRGGIGSSFRAPSYLDLFGSSFGLGNPDLKAESAIGWDIGIEHKISNDHTVIVTYFSNEITDTINSFAKPKPINRKGDTPTEGIELAMRGLLFRDDVNYRLAYTYLAETLSEQPRNHLDASVDWQLSEKLLFGAGLRLLSDHSWGGNDIDGYLLSRIYGSYQLSENVKLHARVENLTNEHYLLSDFYGDAIAGSGTGIYGGVTIAW